VTDIRRQAPSIVPSLGLADDWIPKETYCSTEVAELERERLWPKVWQVACREEDLPNIGSFVTYEILDDSIIVVRVSETEIKAFNNACLHRGRQLTSGCGITQRFACKFHGWKWNLDGSNYEVIDRDDWGPRLTEEDLKLPEFRVGLWGGFVFINMDPDCEPLDEYLAPVRKYLDPFEFEKHRYRWYITMEIEANWKACQEAFQEAYHVLATHSQIEPYLDRHSITLEQGRHSQIRMIPPQDLVVGRHGAARKKSRDGRAEAYELIRQQGHDIQSIFCDRDVQAAAKILTLPEGTSYVEAMEKAGEYMREAAIASGVGYPDLTAQQAYDAGYDWTIFPNTVNVFSPTAGLWYRTRPVPSNDPNRCLLDIYSLERFAPGSAPKVEKRVYKDWKDCTDMPTFLIADMLNIPFVQKGIKTRGFKAARPSPKQERTISGFHKTLAGYLYA